VLGGQIQLIDVKGQPLRLVEYPSGGNELEMFLAKGSPLAHPAVMFRKAAVEQVGLYRKAFTHAEDYDLWLRIHEAGYAIENLKIPLLGYRQHDAKASYVHRRQQALATLVARCAHRARVAGLADPTAGLDRIDENLLDRLPAGLIADFEAELFALRLGVVPFDTREELGEALAAFERVPVSLRSSRSGMRFLLQASRIAAKHHLYFVAATCVSRALSVAPLEVASIVWEKLVGVCRRAYIPRWTRNVKLQKTRSE
jgi:hypothetical protein